MSKCFSLSFLILAALVALCFRASAQDQAASPRKFDKLVYARLADAPEKARDRSNPLQDDPQAVAAGSKLFDLHCAECHGISAVGGQKGPSLRAELVQQATPGTLFWILTNGVVRRGMPVWSKLPEPQRWQLVRYLKSLGPSTPAKEPAPSPQAEDGRAKEPAPSPQAEDGRK